MERYHPHGRTVATPEADVLKLRALEIVLVLFCAESLKGFIISSVKTVKHLRRILSSTNPKTNDEEQASFKKAHELPILGGVITQEESIQLKKMTDYRSAISHEIHRVTIGIGAYLNLTEYDLPNGYKISKHDYSIIQYMQELRRNIEGKIMEKSLCFELSFNTLALSATEQAYLEKIKRLKKKVNAGTNKLNITVGTTNKIIRSISREVMDTTQPDHPKSKKSSGTFSAEGTRGVLMLYGVGVTPFAASYMMRVSYHTASK